MNLNYDDQKGDHMARFLILSVLLSCFAMAEDFKIKGLYCGTRGSFLGTLASEIAIPDYFPPEKFLARLFVMNPLFSNLATCEREYEPVYLGEACRIHDGCYRTLGASKESCDEELLVNWQEACAERYNGDEMSSYCHDACQNMINFMFNTMRYDDGFFCPSCKAYQTDQEEALNNL
jgi:hypothetical protein